MLWEFRKEKKNPEVVFGRHLCIVRLVHSAALCSLEGNGSDE